jgi:hypothetical protein
MNSSTLKEKGFVDFVLLQRLTFSSLPTEKGVVLVLADNTQAGKPNSDILYVGKSKKLAKRVFGGYLLGYGGKNTRKINSKLQNEGYMDKITISWMETENPKQAQQQILDDFKKEHGDCPPWNKSQKAAVKVKPASAKKAPAHSARKKTAKPSS